jgi:WD40 repeat protein
MTTLYAPTELSASFTRSDTYAQVTEVKWIPNQHAVLQSSEDGTVRVWDTRTMEVVQTFNMKPYVVASCDIHSGGNHILASGGGFANEGCDISVCPADLHRLRCDALG